MQINIVQSARNISSLFQIYDNTKGNCSCRRNYFGESERNVVLQLAETRVNNLNQLNI